MANFFSGLAQTAVKAAPFAAQVVAQREAKQKVDRAAALAQLHQQSQDNTANILANIRAGEGLANIGKLNAETLNLREPTPAKRVYDPVRGVMVDESAGTASPITGLPERPTPAVRQDHVVDQVTGDVKFFDPTKPPSDLKVTPKPKPAPAGGGMTSPTRVLSLQSHFNGDQTFKDAQQVATAYQKIKASATGQHTATSDMSLVYGLMKMQDPGSTVREGEYASAENAKGVPDYMRNMYNKVKDGAILSDRQREQFLQTAGSIANAQRSVFTGTVKRYSDMAKRQGVDPADIVFDPYEGLFDDTAAPAAGAAGNIDLSKSITPQERAALKAKGFSDQQITAKYGPP